MPRDARVETILGDPNLEPLLWLLDPKEEVVLLSGTSLTVANLLHSGILASG